MDALETAATLASKPLPLSDVGQALWRRHVTATNQLPASATSGRIQLPSTRAFDTCDLPAWRGRRHKWRPFWGERSRVELGRICTSCTSAEATARATALRSSQRHRIRCRGRGASLEKAARCDGSPCRWCSERGTVHRGCSAHSILTVVQLGPKRQGRG